MKQCDCCERIGIKINSMELFEELQSFFDGQVEQGIFSEKRVRKPYYVGRDFLDTIKWYADKWYKCNVCGTLWEFKYPDFPTCGFVRKFPDGKYVGRK